MFIGYNKQKQSNTNNKIVKLISKIGIISPSGICYFQEFMNKVLENIMFEYTFKYDAAPYYLFETISDDDNGKVLHAKFIEKIKKESITFKPKIFVKVE